MNWSLVKSDDFAQNTFRGVSHDSYLMTHIPSDRGGIELCSVSRKSWFSLTYATRYAHAKYILKIYLNQFTHHFENPHRYQKVQNKILFHFLLVIHPCNNPPTQNRKKLIKSGSCTILRPNFSNFSNLGSLRGWMTNSGNEREFYSAVFDIGED